MPDEASASPVGREDRRPAWLARALGRTPRLRWARLEHAAFLPGQPERDDYHPNLLLVLVHGFRGGPVGTWSSFVRHAFYRVEAEAPRPNVDILSYRWLAGVLERGDIDEAAHVLRNVLTTQGAYSRPAYIFITHSAGTLVLKRMLVDDFARPGPAWHETGIDTPIVARTLQIINFAGAHLGAKPFQTHAHRSAGRLAQMIAPALEWLSRATERLGGAAGQGRYGISKLPEQLSYQGPYATGLAREYRAMIDELRQSERLFRPWQIEIAGSREEVVVPYWAEVTGGRFQGLERAGALAASSEAQEASRQSDEPWVVLPGGTHSSVKDPSAADLARPLIETFTRSIRDPRSLQAALATLWKIADYNRADSFDRLIGTSSAGAPEDWQPYGPYAPLDPGRIGTERDAAFWLLRRLAAPERRQLLLVTGDAGVGKSTVARFLAARASSRFAHGRSDARCLMFPLQSLRDPERLAAAAATGTGEAFLEWLLEEWTDYVNDITRQMRLAAGRPDAPARSIELEPGWPLAALKTEALVVFDGVDELLAKHGIDAQTFMRLIDVIMRQPAPRLRVVCFSRFNELFRQAFGGDRNDEFAIRTMTMAEARAAFPTAGPELAEIVDPQIRKELLRPLFLARLTSRAHVDPTLAHPRVRLLDACVRCAVHDNILDAAERMRHGRERIEALASWLDVRHAEPWIDALGVLAWTMYSRRAELLDPGRALASVQAIERMLREHGQTTGLAPDGDLLTALAILRTPGTMDFLLRRTFFFETRQRQFRFTHSLWEEFLVGWYLHRCVRLAFLPAFSATAFTFNVFTIAGELWRTETVGAGLIPALRRYLAPEGHLGTGSIAVAVFAATIGNSRCSFDSPDTLRDLLALAERGRDMELIVTLHAIGSRGTRQDDGDPSAALLDAVLRRELAMSDRFANPVVQSAVWCYAQLLRRAQDEGTSPCGWPVLQDRADHLEAGAVIAAPDEGTASGLNERVQAGFLTGVCVAEILPHRVVAGVHYLYALACAVRQGVAVPEVYKARDLIFGPSSGIRAAFERYPHLPEVTRIFALSERIWRSGV